MPKSNTPVSGNVKVPKYGILEDDGTLSYVAETMEEIKWIATEGGGKLEWCTIVRLSGTVSYQLAK